MSALKGMSRRESAVGLNLYSHAVNGRVESVLCIWAAEGEILTL